jgi:hypothetical protein
MAPSKNICRAAKEMKSAVFICLSHECLTAVIFAGHYCPHMNSINKCLVKNINQDGSLKKITLPFATITKYKIYYFGTHPGNIYHPQSNITCNQTKPITS